MTTPTETAAQSAATAANAFLVAVIGLDIQQIVWGVIGCVIGIASTKPSSVWYAVFSFGASTMASAGVGTLAARYFGGDDHLARNVSIAITGAIFPFLVAALATSAPSIIQWVLDVVLRRKGDVPK